MLLLGGKSIKPEPWMLAVMEEEGLMDTSEGCISRVAKVLENSPNDVIATAEFRRACYSCNVDPDSFNQDDLDRLQQKLR